MRPHLLLAALLVPAGACSLMGLDEIAVEPCSDDADCAQVNRDNGIDVASACTAYRCAGSKLCELAALDKDGDHAFAPICRGEVPDQRIDCDDNDLERARDDEICDGFDNDCDARIDEGELVPPPPQPADVLPSMPAWASYAQTASDTGLLVLGDGHGVATGRVLTAGKLGEGTDLSYVSRSGLAPEIEAPGCPEQDPEKIAVDPCLFSSVALASAAQRVLYATINTRGCTPGQLRVGLADLQSPFTVRLGTPSNQNQTWTSSNVEFGVDIDPTQMDCTGASRDSDERGAAAPAIAAASVADGEVRAFAAWLATSATPALDDECALPAAVDVEAIGLRLRGSEPSAPLDATTAGGKPQRIGRSASRSPPSIAAWPDREQALGFFVAHAAEDSIALAFAPHETLDAASLGAVVGDPDPHHVVLAVAQRSPGAADEAPELALAWRSGCHERTAIRVARLSVAPGGKSVSVVQELTLRSEATVLAGPLLLHAHKGFSVDSPQGGWVVLWVETDGSERRMISVRIAEAASMAPDTSELGSSDIGLIFPRRAGTSLGYGFVRGGADEERDRGVLMLGDVSCVASP